MPAKKKVVKKSKKVEESNDEEGVSLDDAFGDDEDVEYAESKPRKAKKKDDDDDMSDEEKDEEIEEISQSVGATPADVEIQVKASKPISKVKKGDRITIDGKQLEVDTHYCLIDHGSTKEMAIELFDSKTDKDYQLRYFDDQVETTLEFYHLQEIMYVKIPIVKISW